MSLEIFGYIGTAFISGFLTFFASCLAPLTPTYIAYLAGLSKDEILRSSKQDRARVKWRLIRNAFFFVLGFLVIFMMMGLSATQVGNSFADDRRIMQRVGGIFFIILGLHFAGVIKWQFMNREYKLHKHFAFHSQLLNSFLTGLTFGFGWTPCIGPVLAVIWYWSGQQETLVLGVSLMLVYGLGLGLPFVLLAWGFEFFAPWMLRTGKLGHNLQKLGGIVLAVMGLLMITDQFHFFTIQLVRTFGIDELTF